MVPVADEVRGQKPVAFVVRGARRRPSRAGMVKECALAHGPAYAHPRHVELVAELPLAGTGKVDRRLLIERAEALAGGAARGERRIAMRAAVIREHGGPERLVLEEHFPDPVPGPGEVIVRVRATSLNYHDVFTRRGMPGINIAMPMIMGLDIAGEIDELGPGVDGWAIGDRVLVDPIDRVRGGLMGETVHGGLAERCRVSAAQLIRIPDRVSFEEAAALPVAYGTAYRMMLTQGHVEAGEKVLILGAAGGVGTCCVFLAKIAGAQVIACASSAGEAPAPRRLRRRSRHRLHAGRLRARDPPPLRQAHAPRLYRRRRRGHQLHRRRHVGPVAQVPPPRRAPPHLRRHRRLRPQDRHPLHLDL